MNYKQRIDKLNSFKSLVSVGTTSDEASGFSSDINDWQGGTSKDGYDNYMSKVKEDTESISQQRDLYLSEIDNRIAGIQLKFDNEYNGNKWYFITQQDSNPVKDRIKKINRLNLLFIDSSVKDKIRSMI